MLFVVPYRVDVPLYRWPIANYVLLASLAVCFFLASSASVADVEPYVLQGWGITGLFGHMFLHAGWFHLIGNMIFLWVFGNAVCEKVGNIAYPFVFLGLGLCAASVHNLFSGAPAVGASGAINGVVGMSLVWFPINEISMLYFLWFFVFIRYGLFVLSSYWMVLLWLAFDIFGVAAGGGQVAHWAHLGGFAAGFALAAVLTKLEWVSIYDTERTLLDVFRLRKSWRERATAADRLLAARDSVARTPGPAPVSTPRARFPPLPAPAPLPRPIQLEADARIKVVCACGRILKAKPELAGKTGRCPACHEVIHIPKA